MKTGIFLLFTLLLPLIMVGQSVNLNEGSFTDDTYFIEVPFQYINHKIIIELEIKKVKRKFILDTGAPLVISSALFKEMNCTVLARQEISDINQVKDSLLIVRTDSLKIGDHFLTGVPAVVSGYNEAMNCFGVDGFIGSNAFRNSVIQFDYNRKMVIITNDIASLHLSLADGSDVMLDQQSSPYLKFNIGKKITEFALFDSGADELYSMSTQKIKRFSKAKEFSIIAQAYGSSTIGMTGTATGNETFLLFIPSIILNQGEVINVVSESNDDVNSRIGSHILAYGKLTIDYRDRKYFYEAYTNKSQYKNDQFQVSLNYLNNHLCVGKVWDKQLTKKIKFDEEIISVNEINVEKIPLCEAIDLLKSAKKTTFTIGVRKQNNEILILEIKKVEIPTPNE